MSVLFGSLGLADSERAFATVEGQVMMWQATQQVFDQWNRDAEDGTRLFVQETTEAFKERYYLPGGGTLEELGFDDAPMGEVKRGGSWDVAYPIRNFGAALSYTEVALGYLTVGQYEAAVQTVLNQNNNTLFNLILRAIFKNTNTTFTDPIHGALTCVPLANGDAVLYPPPYGTTAEATQNFYLAPGYAESGISDTNNPFLLAKNTLEPLYGFPEGGSPIAVLCNGSAVPYARLLNTFDEVPARNVQPGDNVTVPINAASSLIPAGGRLVGTCEGCDVVEWPRIPSGWMIALHLMAPKPLKRRVDPGNTGLSSGLQTVTRTLEFPFQTGRWKHRLGFGVGNRIGAVAIALNGTATYTIPTAYQ